MTDRPKRVKKNSKGSQELSKSTSEKEKSFTFSVDGSYDDSSTVNQAYMVDVMRGLLNKSVKPVRVNRQLEGKYEKNKITFAAHNYGQHPDNVEVKGYQRLSDSELRQISMIDPYISAIIVTRCSQGGSVGKLSKNKFEKGLRINEKVPLHREDFETQEEFDLQCRVRESQMSAILNWVTACGTTDPKVVDFVFAGGDATFKKCSLKEFIEAQVRNLLTFGRAGTQIIRNHDGIPIMFRPAPIETIAPAEIGEKLHLGHEEETAEQSLEDLKEYNALEKEERPPAYVQRINGKNVNFFTEEDMHVWYYQKQALFELDGYPLAPIEMSVFMAFIHQQTLSYLKNQFIKGMASKGMIVLESTNPNVQISDADLEDFKQQFHNFVTRTDNSAVTPVIGGPVKANFIPLSTSPRDMEFLQVEEHVIRALCSAFQISPQEMGYGQLGLPQGGLNQANRQEDIIKGEERGLRMLLDVIFEGVNNILYENFPEARDLYEISYVGIGEDTRMAVVSRQQAELNTTATMSSLYSDSDKKETIPYGGNVPLAPLFHANVVKYMKYGIFMEKFFGEKDASKKPEYDFIIDPSMNTTYQQLKIMPVQMQQEQQQLGLKQQEQQMQMQDQQMQMQMQQAEQGQQPSGQPGEQPEQGQEQPQQPMQQSAGDRVSLRDRFVNAQPLQKSVQSYFSEWTKLHLK